MENNDSKRNENVSWKIKNLENRLHLHRQTLEGNKNDLTLRAEEFLNALRNWRTFTLTILGTSLPLILFGFPKFFGFDGDPTAPNLLVIHSIIVALIIGIGFFIFLSIFHHKAFHIVGEIKERYGRVLDFISTQQDAFLETTYDPNNIANDEVDNFDSFLTLAFLIENKMIYEALQGPYGSRFLSRGIKNKMETYMNVTSKGEWEDAINEINFEILPDYLIPWTARYVKN